MGRFLEYGSYTMLPIFKPMGTQYKDVHFDSIKDEMGVDLYTKASFLSNKGMTMSKAGVEVKSEGQLIIFGTKGYIFAESPWWLIKSFEVRFEDSSKKEQYTFQFWGEGILYELSEFLPLIHNKKSSINLQKRNPLTSQEL